MVRRQWVSGVVAITMLLALASTALAQHFQAEPSMFRLGDNSNKRTAEPWEVRAYNARPDGRPDRSSPVWTPSPAKREHKLEANQVAVYHGAIDISSYGADGKPAKREFTAGVYGTVVRSTPGYIAVQLANGNIVQYMHASEARLKFGQQVTPDTVLGVTGNLNTDGKPIPKMGIHLHIQVSDAKGKLLDPDRAILAGRAEKQDRSIKWEKPDWIDAGPLAISSSKPIVSPDGILRADDDNKNAYLRGGNESASAANDGATQRQALEKQKSQLDAQLGELQAQERQLAAELKGIDEQGIALNREGKRMEATEAKLKAERDRLAQLERDLFAEAKAVEAASATVTTNAEVDALNARIIKLNSAFKTFGDDKLAFNAKAEEINQKLKDWQSQIDGMCGRFTLRTKLNVLLAEFAAEVQEGTVWEPRYNVPPTAPVPVVRLIDGKRQLSLPKWGLIPSWAKDTKIAFSTINARADTAATKPAFRSAFKKRRCLVLADGYFEWEAVGKAKLPWFYEIDGGVPFAFAGLWESWWGQGEDKPPLETCTILTTEPNALASRFHDRMPVILHPDDYDAWMQGEEIPLVSFEAERMTARPVSTFVNSVKNQGPECIGAREA